MKSKIVNKREKARLRRKSHVRKTVNGTPDRPRMSVFRSNRHVYVQVIDDRSGHTLVAASTQSPELAGELTNLKKRDAAKKVGALAAQRCAQKNIDKVVFDRNGFLYCGRVMAVAEGAREAGLNF